MFLEFFYILRDNKIPVSLHEFLTLYDALDKELVGYNVEEFYYLCRTALIKKEIHLDRFDLIFSHYFKDAQLLDDEFFLKIPEEWLKKKLQRDFSDEEKKMIEAMGGLEKMMERLKKLLEEQRERHEGGNKWIGTSGVSPFGAFGYNPEGFRIGQNESRNRSAIKIWEKREFANLDDSVELETRNIKMALRKLRTLTREGQETELDLADTIKRTSKNAGFLDISMVPERKNNIKVLLMMDIGGSMDDHVEICSRLFSAAKYEFKHLEFFYFHNCLYETVWKDNPRRRNRMKTMELLNKFNKDYKVIFIGDACMSPYEIMYQGGSIEHYNDESGATWLSRIVSHFNFVSWINPLPENSWAYFESVHIIRELIEHRMFPMTLEGISTTIKSLKNRKIRKFDSPPLYS